MSPPNGSIDMAKPSPPSREEMLPPDRGVDTARKPSQPSRDEALKAVRTLLAWIGEDPTREGLIETPRRVVDAFTEYTEGLRQDPRSVLTTTFGEVNDYDEIIVLRDIRFHSLCEHHLAPVTGYAHIGYIPQKRVVGISKLARLVDVFARRPQVQERLTADIAKTINEILKPKGVAVVVEATHHCMVSRGIKKPGTSMVTSQMLGLFRDNLATREEFLSLMRQRTATND